MIVRAVYQTKRELCVALFNRQLNAHGICPGNHSVEYSHGWFYCDDDSPHQRPELTEEADEIIANGSYVVYYSSVWNTYVLGVD